MSGAPTRRYKEAEGEAAGPDQQLHFTRAARLPARVVPIQNQTWQTAIAETQQWVAWSWPSRGK